MTRMLSLAAALLLALPAAAQPAIAQPAADQPIPTPAAAAAQDTPQAPTASDTTVAPRTQLVAIETSLGTITVALEVERAPVTAANFLRYAAEKRFDGAEFYRAMRLDWGEQPNGLIQGGAQGYPDRVLPPIAHEPTDETGIEHTRGTLSMAMLEPGSATGDWSILLSDMPGLDADPDNADPARGAGYAAFGHVVDGMDVVEAIWNAPLDPDKGEGWMKGQMLAQPVKMTAVRPVESPEGPESQEGAAD